MKLTYKEIKKGFIFSTIIFLVLQLMNMMVGYKIVFDLQLIIVFLFTALYTFSIGYANKVVFLYLDKLFFKDRFSPTRIIVGFFSSFIVSLAVIFLLRVFEDVIISRKSFAEFWEKENPGNYLVAIIITFFITLSFYAFYFYKAYQDHKVKEQKIIAGTASAKFESLKNQIDPHFLFNSLNVLSSLIEENPENAQRFTTSLSKIYRYVLEQKDKELVSVEEELTFAKTYMNLLKMRFENSLFYELPETISNPEAKVVPLSLQLLLENTVKHNVVSEKRPLHIRIYEKDDYLVVENDYQKKEVLQDRQGVGLQNIISRYAILTDRKVGINQNDETFSVYLPLLTKQVQIMETIKITDDTAYYRAKKKVEALKGFYGSLISYCCVIPVLIFINYRTSSFQWFWFPMCGWGIGLMIHAFGVFGYGSNWEERKIKELMEKEDKKQNWQ